MMATAPNDSLSNDLPFYNALVALIERSERDRRVTRRAVKELAAAVQKIKSEFPDYAVLNALTEQAVQDRKAMRAGLKGLNDAISALNGQSQTMPTAIAQSVSREVAGQIETPINKVAKGFIDQIAAKFSLLDNQMQRAGHHLADIAQTTLWRLWGGVWVPLLAFFVGLFLGLIIAVVLQRRML